MQCEQILGMNHLANTDNDTYPICPKSNIEYLQTEIKKNVINNVSKDVSNLHVYSINSQPDNACLKDLNQTNLLLDT